MSPCPSAGPKQPKALWGLSPCGVKALPKPTKTHPKQPCAFSCTQRVNQSQRTPRTAAKVLDPLLLTAGKYKMLLGRRARAVPL